MTEEPASFCADAKEGSNGVKQSPLMARVDGVKPDLGRTGPRWAFELHALPGRTPKKAWMGVDIER
jgi:hypothetical protein